MARRNGVFLKKSVILSEVEGSLTISVKNEVTEPIS